MSTICDLPTALARIKQLESQVEQLSGQLSDCIQDRDIAIKESAEINNKFNRMKSKILDVGVEIKNENSLTARMQGLLAHQQSMMHARNAHQPLNRNTSYGQVGSQFYPEGWFL